MRTWVLSLTAAVAFAGCAASHQARSVAPTGFLGDYSRLKESKDDEALLAYTSPDASWGDYKKIQIDPVTVWKGEKTDIDADDAKALVDYLDAALRKELRRDYEIVDRSGPDVMRLRVAITETERSWVVPDAISTVVPQMRTLSALKRIATGSAAFVGKAGIEGELLDSLTNRRLMAAVDRRVGQKRLEGVFSTWNDVQGAFDHWAERLQERLAELRGASANG